MEIRWKRLLTKALIWLAAEIVLNTIGLDTLADYSEFVFEPNKIATQQSWLPSTPPIVFLSNFCSDSVKSTIYFLGINKIAIAFPLILPNNPSLIN